MVRPDRFYQTSKRPYAQRISNPIPSFLEFDPIPRISILGVGRAKFRKNDSKVGVGPEGCCHRPLLLCRNVTFQERANTGALKVRVQAQFMAFQETTLSSSLRRWKCAIQYRAKAQYGALKKLDRTVDAQEMQMQDAVDDPPAVCRHDRDDL